MHAEIDAIVFRPPEMNQKTKEKYPVEYAGDMIHIAEVWSNRDYGLKMP
jgi:hypothetical protein